MQIDVSARLSSKQWEKSRLRIGEQWSGSWLDQGTSLKGREKTAFLQNQTITLPLRL